MKKFKVNGSDVFFTSDLHFYHNNIINFCNRPVHTVEEMHNLIIQNWNSKVSKSSTVFLLGDVSWKRTPELKKLLEQLNGKIILIIGNHDPVEVINCFEESHDMVLLELTDDDNSKQIIHLSHFPLCEWYGSQKGFLHFHGHCHGSMDEIDKTNHQRIDVGLDSHNMQVLSWPDIKTILNKRYLNRNK